MVSTITPAWLRTSSDFDTSRSASVSGASTPASSGAATPHDSHKQHKSAKQLWKSLKHAVVEHHRGVNQAYVSYYGAGAGSSCPGRRPS